MKTVDKYIAYEKAREREMGKNEAEKEIEKGQILEGVNYFIRSSPLELVSTNGYVYIFKYENVTATCCDQTERVVGEMHKTAENKVESDMFKDFIMLPFPLQEEIKKIYGYRMICIDNDLLSALPIIEKWMCVVHSYLKKEGLNG